MMAKPVSHRAPEFIQGNLEYQVIALGIPSGGFVDDRPRLPGEIEDQVVKLFKPKLSAEMEAKCRARLRLIFATIAEADVAREVYRSRSKSQGRGFDPVAQRKATSEGHHPRREAPGKPSEAISSTPRMAQSNSGRDPAVHGGSVSRCRRGGCAEVCFADELEVASGLVSQRTES